MTTVVASYRGRHGATDHPDWAAWISPPSGHRLVTSGAVRATGRVMHTQAESRLQSEVLEDLRGARHYRRWLVRLVSAYLGEGPITFGRGIGDLSAQVAVCRYRCTPIGPDTHRRGGRTA